MSTMVVNRLRLLLISAFTAAVLSSPMAYAYTHRILPAVAVNVSSAPLQIVHAWAATDSRTQLVCVDFRTARRVVREVDFRLSFQNATGGDLYTTTFVRMGTFSPGVLIRGRHSLREALVRETEANCWLGHAGAASGADRVQISVDRVGFDDGTFWQMTTANNSAPAQ